MHTVIPRISIKAQNLLGLPFKKKICSVKPQFINFSLKKHNTSIQAVDRHCNTEFPQHTPWKIGNQTIGIGGGCRSASECGISLTTEFVYTGSRSSNAKFPYRLEGKPDNRNQCQIRTPILRTRTSRMPLQRSLTASTSWKPPSPTIQTSSPPVAVEELGGAAVSEPARRGVLRRRVAGGRREGTELQVGEGGATSLRWVGGR